MKMKIVKREHFCLKNAILFHKAIFYFLEKLLNWFLFTKYDDYGN